MTGILAQLANDHYYLTLALDAAKKSNCLRRQYGAVIVKNNKIVSTGCNHSADGEAGCSSCSRENAKHNDGNYGSCKSVHAEMNAIINASKEDMVGSTLYLVCVENGKIVMDCEPCVICSRLIKNAGIARICTFKTSQDQFNLSQLKST